MLHADTLFPAQKTLNCKGRIVDLSAPKIMGIVNLTPDSFHAPSRVGADAVVEVTGKMLEDGADFVDLGGYSSRPGADDISVDAELERVLPAIETLVKAFPDILISVDTFRSEVAKQSVDAGAAIVNDISGGMLDERMLEAVGKLDVPYILMHMRGTPKTMQDLTQYDNIIGEMLKYFSERVFAARACGISDIVLDPGFGFSKTVEQNFEVMRQLDAFAITGLPILAGVSRKSMINKTLDISAKDALNGTTVLNTIALTKGAKILRVHDVKEAREAVALWQAMQV